VRIFFAMSRDNLLPASLSTVHPTWGTPWIMTLVTGVLVMAVAGFFSVDEIAELSNTGTLLAFIAVSAGVLVLRSTQPGRPRPFRCPAVWAVAPLAIGGPFLTIRKFAADPLQVDDLIQFGTLDERSAEVLRACIVGQLNVIVSGGTLISRSISEPGFYSGVFPFMPNRQWERNAALLRHLDELRDRLRQLERAARDSQGKQPQ
jgi:amino acid transporter